MPRNQSFDKVNKTKSSKDIYRDINNGVVTENITKSLKRTKKKKSFLSGFSRFLFKTFLIFLILGISLMAGATVAVWSFSSKLPDISKIEDYTPSETSEIYDRNGRILAKLHDEENRTIVPLKEIPLHVQQAVIAMEDERFYQHIGVDPKGIVRAVGSYFDKSLVKGGASTITQQLARNLFLTPEVKITRKIAEWMLAIKIENKFTKSQILELYLNQVYWGHNAYGVEAAAKTFFGKSVKNLDLAEASLIGGLLSSPEYYSPHRDMKLAKWRQSLTLANMVKLGFITKAQADKAKNEPIKLFNIRKSYKFLNPYFTSYVVSVLTEKYGDNLLRRGGLKVYTTMDPKAQALAEKLITTEVPRLKRSNNISQGALVSFDPNTGFIKALVGGTSYDQSQFNRATQAKRQPGSAFKPILYVTAFKEGVITPDSIEVDSPISFPDMGGVWTVHNYEPGNIGAVTIRDALRHSINTIAVKVMDKVGVDKVIETAKLFGIESYIGPNLSVALGTAEVTPIELATAYGVFATGGKKVMQVTPILKIEDRNGNIIEDYSHQELDQVYPHKAINMLNECTKAVVTGGTGFAAQLPGRIVAGKTGTTSDHKDAWFAGYIPQLVTVVWMGNDNNTKMYGGSTGGVVCAPLWKKYMLEVTKGLPVKDFPKGTAAEDAKFKKASGDTSDSARPKSKMIISTEPMLSDEKKDIQAKSTKELANEEVGNDTALDPKTTNVINTLDTNVNEEKIPTLDAVEITPPDNNAPKNVTAPVENNNPVANTKVENTPPEVVSTPIQIVIPKKEVKKNTKKLDEELNTAMEDLKSVKELYNSR
jgi:penicillin-binding protein 1A